MDLYTVSVLVFLAVLGVIIYRDRKNFTREFIILMRKTKRGRGFLKRLGSGHPRFWKVLGFVSVAVGLVVSVWTVYGFVNLTLNNITAEEPVQGVGVVLPSLSSETVVQPGLILPPFWYWIISIALLALVHEGFHGIMAAREKVNIKSVGYGLMAVIPLAFVEPDEKQLKKKGMWSQLRVFSAGSFANFLLAGLVLLISLGVVTAVFQPAGVGYGALMEDYPAAGVNMTGVIVRIENYSIQTVGDLDSALKEIGPNKTVTVRTQVIKDSQVENKTYTIFTAENPKEEKDGFLGIDHIYQYREIKAGLKLLGWGIDFLMGLLSWMFFINLGVGLFNLLPIRGLDGGKMWELIIERYLGKDSLKVINFSTYILIGLVVVNFLTAMGAV